MTPREAFLNVATIVRNWSDDWQKCSHVFTLICRRPPDVTVGEILREAYGDPNARGYWILWWIDRPPPFDLVHFLPPHIADYPLRRGAAGSQLAKQVEILQLTILRLQGEIGESPPKILEALGRDPRVKDLLDASLLHLLAELAPPAPAPPVSVSRSDGLAQPRPRKTRKAPQRDRVLAEMRQWDRAKLWGLTEVAMAATFKASAPYCAELRKQLPK